MKIIVEQIVECKKPLPKLAGKMLLEELGDKYNLTLAVRTRADTKIDLAKQPGLRFYARFEGVSVSDSGTLTSEYGNGASVEEAVENYARCISHKTLRFQGKYVETPEIICLL